MKVWPAAIGTSTSVPVIVKVWSAASWFSIEMPWDALAVKQFGSNAKSEIVMVRPPAGGCGVELATFVRPDHEPGSPHAMATELGMRNICFEVEGLEEMVDRLAANGYGLVGGVGSYEDTWVMAHVRGPDGIVVALTERIG